MFYNSSRTASEFLPLDTNAESLTSNWGNSLALCILSKCLFSLSLYAKFWLQNSSKFFRSGLSWSVGVGKLEQTCLPIGSCVGNLPNHESNIVLSETKLNRDLWNHSITSLLSSLPSLPLQYPEGSRGYLFVWGLKPKEYLKFLNSTEECWGLFSDNNMLGMSCVSNIAFNNEMVTFDAVLDSFFTFTVLPKCNVALARTSTIMHGRVTH